MKLTNVLRVTNELRSVFGTADQKRKMFSDRFDLLRQMLKRNRTFTPSEFNSEYYQITPIKNLIGNIGKEFILFGMLTKMDDDQVFLEDLDSDIRLDLSDASVNDGLYTETCFAMVEGVYVKENLFKVVAIMMPPIELRSETLHALPDVNFFGSSPFTIDDVFSYISISISCLMRPCFSVYR